MLQSLLWRDSLLRVKCHHLHHQVDCLLTSVWNQLAERCWHELWESKVDLSCELVALRPLSLSWTAENSAGFIDLVSFIISREKGSHEVEFSHDGTESKDVNR